MNCELFLKAYNESRNGCNGFIRHWLVRKFWFSDGVNDVASFGCYWLIDIAATETPNVLRNTNEYMGIFKVVVKNYKAKLSLIGSGDNVLWKKKIDFTDLPPGEYNFCICKENNEQFNMILMSEY